MVSVKLTLLAIVVLALVQAHAADEHRHVPSNERHTQAKDSAIPVRHMTCNSNHGGLRNPFPAGRRQWPDTPCETTGCDPEPKGEKWTPHGLWPNDNKGSHPVQSVLQGRSTFWHNWEPFGDSFPSGFAVASPAPNLLDVFAVGGDGALYHTWWNGSSWNADGWEALGGNITSDPVVVSSAPHLRDIFARGDDGACYHKCWDGHDWGAWEALGGNFSGNFAVATSAPHLLDVFARGDDGAVYHRWANGSKWNVNGWEALGGYTTSDPAVVSSARSLLDIFARGRNGACYHKSWDGSKWGNWEPLGGSFSSGFAVASSAPNLLDVFARGDDGACYHRRREGSRWNVNGWQSLGGNITSDPVAVSSAPHLLDVFARWGDGACYHKRWSGSKWSEWESLGGYITSKPAVASSAHGLLNVVASGGDDDASYHTFSTCDPAQAQVCGSACCPLNDGFFHEYCANPALSLCCGDGQVEVNGICCYDKTAVNCGGLCCPQFCLSGFCLRTPDSCSTDFGTGQTCIYASDCTGIFRAPPVCRLGCCFEGIA